MPVGRRSDERQLEAAVFPDSIDARPAEGVGLTAGSAASPGGLRLNFIAAVEAK
jgi:hypothetical protein